jgi:ubiquinol-cytochrome c reductase cytochrome b subunit
MFGSILVWLIIPFLMPKLHIRSSLFRPIVRKLFWFHFFNFLLLGWIGQNVVETPYIEIGQFCTIFYFLYYLVFLPLFSRLEYDLLINGK